MKPDTDPLTEAYQHLATAQQRDEGIRARVEAQTRELEQLQALAEEARADLVVARAEVERLESARRDCEDGEP